MKQEDAYTETEKHSKPYIPTFLYWMPYREGCLSSDYFSYSPATCQEKYVGMRVSYKLL